MGKLLPCIEVQALRYAWSEWDGEFWVYIAREEQMEGWIPLDMLQFEKKEP